MKDNPGNFTTINIRVVKKFIVFKFYIFIVHYRTEMFSFVYEYVFNPYKHALKFCTLFHNIHIDSHEYLSQITSMVGLPNDQVSTHVILSPMKGSCRKVVSIFDSDFIKFYGAETYPFYHRLDLTIGSRR